MYRFTNALSAEFTALHKDWPKFCHAAALFWWGTNVAPTLKIRVPELMREFSDTENYGRYVDGWLFYGDIQDLVSEPDQIVHYTVNINSEAPKAIRVDFYGNDPVKHADAKPFAKFLCKNAAVPMPDSIFERKGAGIWRNLDVATCPATLFKRRNERTVELYAPSIKKKVTFDIPSDSTFVDSLHHTGALSFQNIKDLVNGKICSLNYGSDRIGFFEQDGTNKAILFYPSESNGLLPTGFFEQKTVLGTWSDVN